ncbi:MAG: DctP family TRAP transporter solute-binding subunit [Salipiger marinus]|uniref:DctP family TRAP transporter solute-binding subunit n=1 Tax=Salipiger marinus TaxID=555512 RepID=UPI004058526C
MNRREFATGIALTGGLMASPALLRAQGTALRFAHYGTASDSVSAAATRLAELAAEKTGGALTVEVYGNGELGSSPTMLEGTRLGTIDMATTGNPYFTASLPALNLLDLPFLFQSDAHAFAVLDGEVGQTLMSSMSEAGLQGIAFWELGFRNLTNNVRAVVTPEDMAGLKIRTTPNPAHVLAFETLGAQPTPMPFGEVYSALQTGAIDGQENPVNHIYANKLHEVQTFMSLTRHAYTTSPLVVNARRWSGLSPEFQTALQEAALEAATFQRQLNDEEDVAALEEMRAAGLQIEENPDTEAFRAAVSDVTRAAYVEQFGAALLDQVDAAATA